MIADFQELISKVRGGRVFRLCVAEAGDQELLQAVKMAVDMGFAYPVLTGDKDRVREAALAVGLEEYELLAGDCPEQSAALAVQAVREGRADVLMKGAINTAHYMRAILNKENGLRSGRLLSALAVYEVREYHKLIFCSDSGINVAPDLEQKKDILANALEAMRRMGMESPKVVALTANEVVHPKVQATVDAAELVRLAGEGAFGSCIVEGPIAFDVAFDRHAAEHKGIDSKVSGEVDLILAPNIETGNALGKSWLTLNKAKWAGLVLGTTHPVVLGSRSDTAEVKINSIALACLLAQS
ncbi:phosphate butyryltransferase [Paucidesulfovibrio gracilis DSM 16080]|uniref:Phosphate butyryltransferase n=1 Tax=Paucidesulfovibrio gracilis DSM 16080 TaxID=1121449 RepID=A0A1T4X0I1_9BACT|nr:phosphate acyltransferase [Paucidesulfovibrio gracilis]SKA82595.1 phosphate butyryltransferase [Paucidesulfovibrio gracilis DSM 16080]